MLMTCFPDNTHILTLPRLLTAKNIDYVAKAQSCVVKLLILA